MPEIEKINSNLHFETSECKITGNLELYSTKRVGSDKKLQKELDKQLDEQYESGSYIPDSAPVPESSPTSTVPIISPPDESTMSTSLNNNSSSRVGVGSFGTKKYRSSSFNIAGFDKGSLINQRDHASQIGGPQSLNPSIIGSSPFGPLDQPASRRAFSYVISILNASDPDHDFSLLQPIDFKRERSSQSAVNAFTNLFYGLGIQVPESLWSAIDREIDLNECHCYSHTPSPSYLADEPGTMWAHMWFFLNKRRKRVVYLNLRAVRSYARSPLMTAQDMYHRRRRDSNMAGIGEDEEMEEDYDLNEDDDRDYYDDVVGDFELE